MTGDGGTQTTPTTCPLDCPDACGVLVEANEKGEFESLRGNPEHSYSKGSLCSKTSLFAEVVSSPDRLRKPLVRADDGELREASWDEATTLIADRVRGLRGEEILALPYAGNMGHVSRRFPLRIMNALNAAQHDGGICDTTGTLGYESVLGRTIGADLESVEEADCLVLWGVDVARTVQHLQPAIQRMCKRGTRVIAIDIYRTETLRRVEAWGGRGIVLEPGTDAALALGVARLLFEQARVDRGFLDEQCIGATQFEAHVLAAHDLDWVASTCGLGLEDIEELARVLGGARHPFIKVGVGWTRRRNGAHGMRAVCSLAAVLGAADSIHYESGDHFGFDTSLIERPELRSEPVVPQRHVELGKRLTEGEFRAVFVWGHNPVVTLPDAARVREGLARKDTFVVVHDLFLTETAEVADVVLPAASFLEQNDVYGSYGHRVAQFSRAACAAPGEARGNVATFAAIAEKLGLPSEIWQVSGETLCLQLLEGLRERVGPSGFEELLQGRPTKLPLVPGTARGTRSGKVELVSAACEPPLPSYVPDELAGNGAPDEGDFALIPAPSRATHNSTYMHSARHLAKAGKPRCFVNPLDASELGVAEGERLRLSNSRAAITLEVVTTTDVPRGCIRVDGLVRAQDVPERVGINALVAPATSAMAHGNTLYSTRVNARPAGS